MMSDDLSLLAANQCQLWWTPVYWHTFFRAAPCNVRVLQPGDPHAVDNWRKRIKRVLFFFFPIPRGHHFKMSCWGCEFLPDPTPTPALSGGKSTDFLCLNGLAKDNFICIWKREEKRRKEIQFIFCAPFVLPLWNGCSVIVLCFMRGDLKLM